MTLGAHFHAVLVVQTLRLNKLLSSMRYRIDMGGGRSMAAFTPYTAGVACAKGTRLAMTS